MRCPDNKDGTHRSDTSQYEAIYRGVTHRCSCGQVTIFPTDEMIYESQQK